MQIPKRMNCRRETGETGTVTGSHIKTYILDPVGDRLACPAARLSDTGRASPSPTKYNGHHGDGGVTYNRNNGSWPITQNLPNGLETAWRSVIM